MGQEDMRREEIDSGTLAVKLDAKDGPRPFLTRS